MNLMLQTKDDFGPSPAARAAVGPRVRANILETIGDTPVVRVTSAGARGRRALRQARGVQPDGLGQGPPGARRDRGRRARRRRLKPGQTVIEATSGNTGIGLAMVCAAKGYPLVVTMAESFSVERRRLMRFLGARVILTPASEKGSGMLAKARELADKHGWFLCRQFENEANADMHSRTTAEEILARLRRGRARLLGDRLRHRRHAEGRRPRAAGRAAPSTKIVGVEPDNSQLLGERHRPDATSRMAARRRAIRASARTRCRAGRPTSSPSSPTTRCRPAMIDRLVPVAGAEALPQARELARREGIFCGITGGRHLRRGAGGRAGPRRRARASSRCSPTPASATSRRRSSSDVAEAMTDDELAIAASTPSYRFDAPADGRARRGAARADARGPSASSRRRSPIPARRSCSSRSSGASSAGRSASSSRDGHRLSLDRPRLGRLPGAATGAATSAPRSRTRVGAPTIPQIFVGGAHVGGCTEMFDAFNDGQPATPAAARAAWRRGSA